MEIFKGFKLFGLYFYVSDVRMRRRPDRDQRLRNKRKLLGVIKRQLYTQQAGCCNRCGRRYDMDCLEMHHIVSVKDAPHLACTKRNIELLCHECHRSEHPCGETAGRGGEH